MFTGGFPESLSQAILVGIMLAGRLDVLWGSYLWLRSYPKERIRLKIALRLNEHDSVNLGIRLQINLMANFRTLNFGYVLRKGA